MIRFPIILCAYMMIILPVMMPVSSRMCIKCVKNVFGILVYSKEYVFPFLDFLYVCEEWGWIPDSQYLLQPFPQNFQL
jgi:hypothetical protein